MRLAMVLSGLIVLAGLTACGDDGETGTDRQVFGDADSTSEAMLAAGERFEVRLESNPSTGYAWEVSTMSEDSLVNLVDHRYVAPDSDLVGAAGTEVWEFSAGPEGAGILRLEYIRSFDDLPVPDRVFELVVRIDGAEWPPPGGSVPTTGTATAPTEIGDLLSSTASRDVIVRGAIVWTEIDARLCEALAESFPPQCAGASVVIADPDELDVELSEAQGVRWTDLPIELAAHFDGTRLVIGAIGSG
jgi:inhibitor of cysteine peptidase